MAPMLSVIVPVYNVAPFLEKCVSSVLAQTYTDLELILIDDGSTDGSGELCDTLAATDSRIVVIHQANAGVSAARNAGLAIAQGTYIGFADPDDWLDPEMFSVLINRMEEDGTEAAFCGYWEDYETPNASSIEHAPQRIGIVSSDEALYQCMIGVGHGYFTSVWNKCFRSAAILNHKFPEDCQIAEDELWLAWIIPGMKYVSLTSQMLYHWRQRPESACHKQVVDKRWYKALETKRAAADILAQNPERADLAYGKVYSDLCHCIWIGHCADDLRCEAYFREQLNYYWPYLWRSKEYSPQKKLKLLVVDWMCQLHFPQSWIKKIGIATSKKIRNSIKNKRERLI